MTTVIQVQNVIQTKKWDFELVEKEKLFASLKDHEPTKRYIWGIAFDGKRPLQTKEQQERFISMASDFLASHIMSGYENVKGEAWRYADCQIVKAKIESKEKIVEGEIKLLNGKLSFEDQMIEVRPYYNVEKDVNIYPIENFPLFPLRLKLGRMLEEFVREEMLPWVLETIKNQSKKETIEKKPKWSLFKRN